MGVTLGRHACKESVRSISDLAVGRRGTAVLDGLADPKGAGEARGPV